MRRTICTGIALSLLAVAAAACTGAGTTYQPLPEDAAEDGAGDGTDSPGFLLVVPDTELTVTEGQVTSFSVSLSQDPGQLVTVTIAPADTTRISAPQQLQFDSSNYATPQDVSVTALSDDDAMPNTVQINVSAPGATDAVHVNVHVTDDDTLAIHANTSQVEVTEGLQTTVKVKLTANPVTDTTVAIALNPALPGVASVSPASLMFTAATWDTEQDVVITAEQDLDIQGATSMLELSSSATSMLSLPVTVFDDDVVQISPNPTALGTINEGGAAAPLGISLTRDPGGPVHVTVTPSLNGKVTITPSFVDFTSANWNMVQTVQVAGAQDADTADDPLQLTLSAAGALGILDRTVSVTVHDDDTAGIVAGASQVTVTEGQTVQLGVHLAFDPLGTVTVTAASNNPTIASITAGTTLTFDSSNYSQNQNITIRAEQDNDLQQDDTFVTFQATALGATLDVPIHKPDDDQQVIQVDTTGVTLNETGQTTFMVKLGFRPNGNVSVMASAGGSTHASVTPTSIPFTVGNYNTYQQVTVTGTHDVDLVPDNVPITLSGASAPANVTVTANVLDVDDQFIQTSASNLTVTEGLTGTFTVRLPFQPTASTTIMLMSNSTAVATVSPAMITFNSTNYATPVTVTVTGAQDANAVQDMTSISLTGSGLAPVTVGVTALDDDVQGLDVSMTSLTLTEGMTTMTLGVRLNQDPVTNVTVSAASLDPSIVGVSGGPFTFTSGNYTTYQYITVDALQDNDLATDNGTIRFTAVSPALTRDVPFTKPDDDTQAIDTSVGSVTLSENGTTTFGVRLRYQPAGSITVSVSSADANKATASGSLTFLPGNYSTFQTVTVTGTDDNNLTQETVNINLTSPGNAPLKSVSATVNDDDMQAIQGVPASINLTEGNQTTINVRLAFQPSTPSVTVNVGAGSSTTAAISTSGNLTFSNTNWQTTQPVTITALQDVDLQPGAVTLTLSGATAPNVTSNVMVADDDVLTIVTAPVSPMTVNENSSSSFTVQLSNQPNGPVTVNLADSPGGVVSLGAASIPFTTSNWNMPVTVTVTPVPDVDNQTESTTVTLSSGATSSVPYGITVNDTTVVSTPGWASYFGSTATFMGNTIWAYKITTGGSANWTLDNLGMITNAAGNMTKMALYSHDGTNDRPLSLITSTSPTTVASGTNTFATSATTLTPNTTYWIAFMVSGAIPIGDGGAGNQARRCQKATFGFSDAFQASFGSPTCQTVDAINVFATMHQ